MGLLRLVTQIGLPDVGLSTPPPFPQALRLVQQLIPSHFRMNLDPYQIHDDTSIWNALKLAGLGDFVAGLSEGKSKI